MKWVRVREHGLKMLLQQELDGEQNVLFVIDHQYAALLFLHAAKCTQSVRNRTLRWSNTDTFTRFCSMPCNLTTSLSVTYKCGTRLTYVCI